MSSAICPQFADWVRPNSKDINSALCLWCRGSVLDLTTMGRTALTKHALTKKHISNGKILRKTSGGAGMASYLVSRSSSAGSNLASGVDSDARPSSSAAGPSNVGLDIDQGNVWDFTFFLVNAVFFVI